MKLISVYNALGPVLRPFGLPYDLVMRARRTLYRQGIFRTYRASCPVVSVGNIAWGGSGKTPLTSWLLDYARDRALNPVVLSRGYLANPGREPLLVRPDTPVARCGDEPLMLARAHPRASVIVSPRRAEAARFAERALSPDLIILDDGMQHLGIGRDCNLVLLRPDDLDRDWDRVIPSGPWREGAGALAEASAFLIKIEPEQASGLESLIRHRLERYHKPVFSFHLRARGLRPLFPRNGSNGPADHAQGGFIAPEDYHDRPYVLVSGIGNPAGVEATATRLMGRSPLQHFDFSDHHAYTGTDVQAVRKMLAGPLPVLCTAKDAVKLAAFQDAWDGAAVWSIETEVKYGPGFFTDQTFASWWEQFYTKADATCAAAGNR